MSVLWRLLAASGPLAWFPAAGLLAAAAWGLWQALAETWRAVTGPGRRRRQARHRKAVVDAEFETITALYPYFEAQEPERGQR